MSFQFFMRNSVYFVIIMSLPFLSLHDSCSETLFSHPLLLYNRIKLKRNGWNDVAYKDEQLHEEKVFKDTVHRYVHVRDRDIAASITTPEFQRLRSIKQLATTNQTINRHE